jgi:hypothetical protein
VSRILLAAPPLALLALAGAILLASPRIDGEIEARRQAFLAAMPRLEGDLLSALGRPSRRQVIDLAASELARAEHAGDRRAPPALAAALAACRAEPRGCDRVSRVEALHEAGARERLSSARRLAILALSLFSALALALLVWELRLVHGRARTLVAICGLLLLLGGGVKVGGVVSAGAEDEGRARVLRLVLRARLALALEPGRRARELREAARGLESEGRAKSAVSELAVASVRCGGARGGRAEIVACSRVVVALARVKDGSESRAGAGSATRWIPAWALVSGSVCQLALLLVGLRRIQEA